MPAPPRAGHRIRGCKIGAKVSPSNNAAPARRPFVVFTPTSAINDLDFGASVAIERIIA